MNMIELEQQFDGLLEAEEYGKADEMPRRIVEEVPKDERRDAFTAPVRIRSDAIGEPEAESLLLDAANTPSRPR